MASLGTMPYFGGKKNVYGTYDGGLVNVEEVHLDYNHFTGMISSDVENLVKMTAFHIHNNKVNHG